MSEASIHSAVAIDADAQVFTTFGDSAAIEKQIKDWFAQQTEAARIRRHEFEENLLTIRIPIVEFNTVIACLFPAADPSDIREERTTFTCNTCLVCTVALVTALVVSRPWLESITKPMLGLAETATNRSQRKDDSVRVTHKVDGEPRAAERTADVQTAHQAPSEPQNLQGGRHGTNHKRRPEQPKRI